VPIAPAPPCLRAAGRLAIAACGLVTTILGVAHGDPPSLDAVRDALMRPAEVEPAATIDRDGLRGRVLCGYQGWFTAEGDGADLGWRHWRTADPASPTGSRLAVDLLPDVSELTAEERFATDLLDPDGKPVEVFSSHRKPTVIRHFRWMEEHGIDGVFVQRFAVDLDDTKRLAHATTVLAHCRQGALTHGRVYAVMYDLTGMKRGSLGAVLDDWRLLHERMQIGRDAASLTVTGRPLVAVWGIGFGDGRDYTLADCRDLVAALKAEGCAVMCGLPTGWRTLDRDAVDDPALHDIAALADIVSPWTVGRYREPADVTRHADRDWAADLAWCQPRGIDYLPVVFPGFSWHNLKGGPLDEIPRRRGDFFWTQVIEARRVGASGLYVAMFDEVDEATAIFKCAEPEGELAKRFVSLDGVPSDHYLALAGAAGRLLRSKPSTTAPTTAAAVARDSNAASPSSAIPTDPAAFARDLAPAILAARPCDPKHWRQIEPALHHLAIVHADRLTALPDAERVATLAKLAGFIDAARDRTANVPVLAPGRTVIGLLDPATGLGPKEVTAIAEAYGGTPTIHKKDAEGETIASVADAFLADVRAAIAAGKPTTVVVLGHGLPTEIQSYGIRFERLAAALLDSAAARAGQGSTIDLRDLVLVCDDCFSADFTVNLLTALETGCRDRGLSLGSLPVCIAGTNHDRYGLADVGETFVPHFWKDVIELYFVRRPRPKAVVLRNFFENVDNMMYGYGRTPMMEGTTVTGWKLVDPALVQDPVVFVPLSDEAVADLRAILGLDAATPLPHWLDVG
jgi:hypothetical protein